MKNLKVNIKKDGQIVFRGILDGYISKNGEIYGIVINQSKIKAFPIEEIEVSNTNPALKSLIP